MMSRLILGLTCLCLWLGSVWGQVGDVQVIGANVISQTEYSGPLPGAHKVFLMQSSSYIFTKRAVIFSFLAYFKNTNPVKFQVWRPAGSPDSFEYELVWEFHVTPQDSDLYKRAVINVTNNNCFMAQNGDRLAFLNEREDSAIAHEFLAEEEAALFYALDDVSAPSLGDKAVFDTLGLPYGFQFAAVVDADAGWYGNNVICRPDLIVPGEPIPSTTPGPTPGVGPKGEKGEKGDAGARGPTGANGDVGPAGPPGQDGPRGIQGDAGDPGPAGGKGDKGDRGNDGISVKGERGLPGAIGPAGPPGPAGPQGDRGTSGGNALPVGDGSDCECGEGLLQKGVILGLIVWLLILTLLIIMLIILMTVRRKEYHNTRDSLRSMRESAAWVHTTEPWAGKDPYVVDTMSR